jgi:UPF0755 protein
VFFRRLTSWVSWLSGLFAVFLGLLIFVPYGGGRGIRFSLSPGARARVVAAALKDDGVIVSQRLFLGLALTRGVTRHLQAGIYELDGRQSLWRVVSMLGEGRVGLVRTTIPEGYASWQIAARLESLGVCPQGAFLAKVREAHAEGFLFPQTYFFRPGMKAAEVVSVMRGEFEKNWRKSLAVLRPPVGLDRKGVVTLASLVEREAKKDFERPLVSAVFLNRLRKHWRLESCATVQYSLGGWKPALKSADLKIPSPYNTYLHGGLPPGPICSPGLASLRAVFFPSRTDALFFQADGQGTHSFFTTYKEHAAEKLRRKRPSSPRKRESRTGFPTDDRGE